jgi:hypothetical protein
MPSRRLSENLQSEGDEFLKILGPYNRSARFVGKQKENLL